MKQSTYAHVVVVVLCVLVPHCSSLAESRAHPFQEKCELFASTVRRPHTFTPLHAFSSTPKEPRRNVTLSDTVVTVMDAHVANSSAALASTGVGVPFRVLLRITPRRPTGADSHAAVIAQERSCREHARPLLALCTAALWCPSGAFVDPLHVTLRPTDHEVATVVVDVQYGCHTASSFQLLSATYVWGSEGGMLAVGEHTVLLRFHGLTQAQGVLALTITKSGRTPSSQLLLFSSAQQTRLVLLRHSRPGPVAAALHTVPVLLHTPWATPSSSNVPRTGTVPVARHGCYDPLSQVGAVVWHSAAQRQSTLQLFHVPSTKGTTTTTADLLLDVSTTYFSEADANLLLYCGFAQRLIFSRCSLTFEVDETPLAGPSAFSVVLEVEADVEAPVADLMSSTTTGTASAAFTNPSQLFATSSVPWCVCGVQRLRGRVWIAADGGRNVLRVTTLTRASFTPTAPCVVNATGAHVTGHGRAEPTVRYATDGDGSIVRVEEPAFLPSLVPFRRRAASFCRVSYRCREVHSQWWEAESSSRSPALTQWSLWMCETVGLSLADFATIVVVVWIAVLAAVSFSRWCTPHTV